MLKCVTHIFMIDINITNIDFFENLISDIVDWADTKGWVNWETGEFPDIFLTEANAYDCLNNLPNLPEITIDDFLDLFINLNMYAEIVNDVSIDAAFKTHTEFN